MNFSLAYGITKNAQISHGRENLEPIFPRKLDGFYYAERPVIGAVGEVSKVVFLGEK